MTFLVPEAQRRFAIDVVGKLRGAGYQAYWAGGCVRDQLLRRTPKDYDVATDALPEQIRELFTRRRTIAVGAAFGVIAVVGPRGTGLVEVATFREDAAYSDGRHPDHVRFSTAANDAARRDFTINGLFYDPVDDRVIDYVGGQEDLAKGLIRAIGDPYLRFEEDKLRLLRAVRFAATFEFAVEPRTFEAVRRMAGAITVVSAERIAAEMERMLVDRHRGRAVRLLLETGLAAAVLPEIVSNDATTSARIDETLAVIEELANSGFPLALASLLRGWVDAAGAGELCRRWKLSNRQTDRVTWLIEHRTALADARHARWSCLQPLLVAEGADDLICMEEAVVRAQRRDASHVAWCRLLRLLAFDVIDPPRLVTGDDLTAYGIPRGPQYRTLLQLIRDAQLDAEIHTKAAALELAARLWNAMKEEREGIGD